MKIVVCGGAGYIGSHMFKWLADRGHIVTVVDSISTDHRDVVRWMEFVQAERWDARSRGSCSRR